MKPALFPHPPLDGYALLDSGGAEKLERFGEVVLRRPDPQALWRPRLEPADWDAADLAFVRESDRGGRWEAPRGGGRGRRAPTEWRLTHGGASFVIRPTPVQARRTVPRAGGELGLRRRAAARAGGSRPPGAPEPLRLHRRGQRPRRPGRLGRDPRRRLEEVGGLDPRERGGVGARRAGAARAGRGCPGVRSARGAAREPVRGDLARPAAPRARAKGERWQFEEDLAPLVETCAELLAPRALLVLSTYAIGYSPLAFWNLLDDVPELAGGELAVGELALPEEERDGRPVRLLPAGYCARWWRDG